MHYSIAMEVSKQQSRAERDNYVTQTKTCNSVATIANILLSEFLKQPGFKKAGNVNLKY